MAEPTAKSTNKRVTFYLPEDTIEAMEKAKKHYECSRNDIIVWLVNTGLKNFVKKEGE